MPIMWGQSSRPPADPESFDPTVLSASAQEVARLGLASRLMWMWARAKGRAAEAPEGYRLIHGELERTLGRDPTEFSTDASLYRAILAIPYERLDAERNRMRAAFSLGLQRFGSPEYMATGRREDHDLIRDALAGIGGVVTSGFLGVLEGLWPVLLVAAAAVAILIWQPWKGK